MIMSAAPATVSAPICSRRACCSAAPSACAARAAALFYNEGRFLRSGAMPEPVRATLLGKGGVQPTRAWSRPIRYTLLVR